jgi:hypothetical protein
MEGIRYIINDKGEKKAAVIDLDTYGHLWDDIHDILPLNIIVELKVGDVQTIYASG